MTRPRVYIAGPMSPTRGGGPIEYLRNCNRMIDAARELIKAGLAPFCPAVDMLYFIGGMDAAQITAEEIKAYSLAWLPACEAVLLMPGWMESVGTRAEAKEAKRLGMQVFTCSEFLIKWFAGK
jgi:hypothetical protein